MARELLGCVLAHDTPEGAAAGMIVETEGYMGEADMASHARFGRTNRSSVLFGPPGHAYVYFIYGMYYMFNVVAEREGVAGAVLVRALEPTEGLSLMAARRGKSDQRGLCNGPGRLCQALGITLEQNGRDLLGGPLGIWRGLGFGDEEVEATARVGVTGSREEPYRYLVKGNRYVSGYRMRRR